MHISPSAYALIGLTAIVACLVKILTFAFMRMVFVARDNRRCDRQHRDGAAVCGAGGAREAQDAGTRDGRAGRSVRRLSGEITSSRPAPSSSASTAASPSSIPPGGRFWTPDSSLYAPSPREQPLLDVIEECLKSGLAIVRRGVTLSEVGHGVHLGVTVSPLFDGEGQLHGAICLFTDLTAVRDLEEQLRLKESLATVGELTAGSRTNFATAWRRFTATANSSI